MNSIISYTVNKGTIDEPFSFLNSKIQYIYELVAGSDFKGLDAYIAQEFSVSP